MNRVGPFGNVAFLGVIVYRAEILFRVNPDAGDLLEVGRILKAVFAE